MMGGFVFRRALQVIPVLVIASIVIWAVIYMVPGSPANAIAGANATPDQLAAINERLGLDKPVIDQYWLWLTRALTGDLGRSAISQLPVTTLLMQRTPASLQLAAFAIVFGVGLALPLGMVGAVRPDSLLGRIVAGYQIVALAVPTFWVGILLILVFGVDLRVLPGVSAYVPFWEDPIDCLKNIVLPAMTLGIFISGIIARFLASSLSVALTQPYVTLARSKGVPEARVIVVHALRNALLPTVTIVGLELGEFLGGAVVTESVFNYPGLGRLIYAAVTSRDYPVIQGALLLIVVAFVTLNLVVDIVYSLLDPRMRLT
jgi:peptide/nickel transport system permease protein